MDSFADTWQIISDYCKKSLSTVAYDLWINKLNPVSIDFDKGIATLEVPNNFHKQTIERCYASLLDEAFASVFGDSVKYTIVVHDDNSQKAPVSEKKDFYNLTFDTFVVGPSNSFAAAVCKAVAANPANVYNPLFIYGNPGLGKTHLLNAISHEIKKNFPEKTILYVKSEDFTNELIASLGKNMSAFREKYRHADVFMIDDIQFIGGKESSQEEVFHTFNTLYESNKQIILTSDRPPKEIATLEERLRNRFESGLMADIQPPVFETRVAIIKSKADDLDIIIPDSVCEFIANRVKSNIRQLEGVVKKLKAYYLLEGKSPSIATAQAAISDILNSDIEQTPVTVDRILEEVSRNYGVTTSDILSQKRNSKISLARQVVIYVIREITQMPMESIGESIGHRDHSTVVYSIQQIERRMKTDPSVKANVEDIIKNIRDR
jgi:chromosomal replication initiator protein